VTLDRPHPGEAAPDLSVHMRAARFCTTPRPATAWVSRKPHWRRRKL